MLHNEFRVTNNIFTGTRSVTIINKKQANIKARIFGGLPREITIESIAYTKTIAMVNLRLQSAENFFVPYNSLVLGTDNEWKIIDNLAVVETKK